jgi:hypothetical protein
MKPLKDNYEIYIQDVPKHKYDYGISIETSLSQIYIT